MSAVLAACGGGGNAAPPPSDVTIAGHLSGLGAGKALLIANVNASGQSLQSITLVVNGSYTFTVTPGMHYDIRVVIPPLGETCTIANASGTASTTLANLDISCADNAASGITLTGTLIGLATGQSLVLHRTPISGDNGEDLVVSANGSFHFTRPVAGPYTVTLKTLPQGQTCAVTNGSGTSTTDVNNIGVSCAADGPPPPPPPPPPSVFTIGGTLTSSKVGTSVVLQNNGGDDLQLGADGSYTFSTPVNNGAAYNVTVKTQSIGATCTVFNGSGIAAANVINVYVACHQVGTFAVGGTISGVVSSVILEDNITGDGRVITNNGPFIFINRYNTGDAYDITDLFGKCTVTNGSGIVGTKDVTDIVVSCPP